MYRIAPQLRDYAWGTVGDIAGLLGIDDPGVPLAEAWWGAHDAGPSIAVTGEGNLPLDAVIARDPLGAMGAGAAATWRARLPFLLKVLAIEKPLSIQVHPNLEQARDGFAREQLHRSQDARTFLDPFHKPEMLYALTPMTVLVGVRPLDGLAADLERLGTDEARALRETLAGGDAAEYIRRALVGPADAATLAALGREGALAEPGSSLRVSAEALARFPGDPGALVALALNVVQLEPGDAVYTGAGVLHSYQSGLGVEVMANSDNVVRGGLTPKPMDVPLLLELARTEPSPPEVPGMVHDGAALTLTTEVSEFALTVVRDGEARVPVGPRIVLAFQGSATVEGESDTVELSRGEAVFVRHSDGPVHITATGTTVVAHLP